jgi:hypothetical protein
MSGSGPVEPLVSAGTRRDSTITTKPAVTIAARRRASLPGLAGRCSWKSRVPAIRKYVLLVTMDTGTRMDARPACKPTWNTSRAAAEQPASTYRYGDEITPTAILTAVWWPMRIPEIALMASAATP